MFNFLKKDIHTESISNIEKQIEKFDSFKYFSQNNSNLLMKYKEFEVTIIASALYSIFVDKKNSEIESKKINEIIKKIYFNKSSEFLRNQILSGNLSWNLNSAGKIPNETKVIFDVFVKFNRYKEQINSAIQNNLPYWVEEFENSDYTEDFDANFIGVKHYYPFIINILISEIKEDEDRLKYISKKEEWQLEDLDLSKINIFVKELILIKPA